MAKSPLYIEREVGRSEDAKATIGCSKNATSIFYCTTDTAMEPSV
jgi:hypothetical protein